MDTLDFLRQEGVSEAICGEIAKFRKFYGIKEDMKKRIPNPPYNYYGAPVWEEAAAALLAGENLLLSGPKATGKNVLAQGLSNAFGRPEWDISLYINTDASSLIGADTFEDGKVTLRKGPILRCAEEGGFGILDEINMAKNEALAVLHGTLDFRRAIDVPGYSRIPLSGATRFIGTMNYGYAGTRELNEALASRFMIIQMPVFAEQFAELFAEIRRKCEGGEVSTKSLDLRGLLSAIELTKRGLPAVRALNLGIVNKCFDEYERQLISDMVTVRFPGDFCAEKIFS